MPPKKQDAKGGKGGKGGKTDPKKGALPAKNKSGGKPKKKSWTKVKVKDKLNNAVFVDAKAFDRITKELGKQAVITVASVCDKFKVNGAVARKVLRELTNKNIIKVAGDANAHITIYTGNQRKAEASK